MKNQYCVATTLSIVFLVIGIFYNSMSVIDIKDRNKELVSQVEKLSLDKEKSNILVEKNTLKVETLKENMQSVINNLNVIIGLIKKNQIRSMKNEAEMGTQLRINDEIIKILKSLSNNPLTSS